ncbi:hypothetical protein ACFB49_41160 [Sphingomonas sp. DBB INV C78]|uniref:hypothetical protein n=1 Tax=Sphingomonas sp. DBB INV C78 TaxID=3349434 RepID=UPI0036D3CDBD
MSLLAALLLAQAAPAPVPADIAGYYNGSRMELAAELVLHPDGRFDYGLSYGALDEVAAGQWSVSEGAVVLESDPVRPPVYSFSDLGAEQAGLVVAKLVLPQGLQPQFFSFALVGDGIYPIEGKVDYRGEAQIAFDPAHPPAAIRVLLPIYELVSDPFPLDLKQGGRHIEVRFTPNDLGRIAFQDTHLPITDQGLTFERFGEKIIFRKR